MLALFLVRSTGKASTNRGVQQSRGEEWQRNQGIGFGALSMSSEGP